MSATVIVFKRCCECGGRIPEGERWFQAQENPAQKICQPCVESLLNSGAIRMTHPLERE